MQDAPERLRCEYLEDPLGIDTQRPRLSWCIGDRRPAEVQTGYQVLAASHPDLLAMDEGDLWDSGRIAGRDTIQIEYDGKRLGSGRRVWWKVRCFDSDGVASPWSLPGYFEAGLLDAGDWQGRWISTPLQGSRLQGTAVPLLERRFELTAPVRQARMYVAALGQVAVMINGERFDCGEQAPGWVDYLRRAEYLTLDLDGQLVTGENTLTILLADGWYAGDPGTGTRQQYGERAELLVQLNLITEDGQTLQICSDESWCWRPSWVLAADPVRGESMDARQARGASEAIAYPVTLGVPAGDRGIALCAAGPGPVAAAETLAPRSLQWQDDGGALIEFPRPVMGRIRVGLAAPAGGVLRAAYGNSLTPDGRLEAQGEDTFVAAGHELGESFEALFSLQGFRFAHVSGDVYRQGRLKVEAVPVAAPLARSSLLITDHPRINHLHDVLIDHLASSCQTVIMSGLTPSARLSEAALTGHCAGSLLRHLDAAVLLTRWLRDMADGQLPEGGFPAVVPAMPAEESRCGEGPAGASDGFLNGLWQLYRHCGDRRVLRSCYSAVKRLVAGSVARSDGYIRDDLHSDTSYPADLAATAWLFRSARLAARIAGVLGNLSDLEDYEVLAGRVRSAFRKRFVTRDGRVIGDDVAVYALTLGCGLLDVGEHQRAAGRLVGACEAALADAADGGRRLLEVPLLLGVLTDLGRLDLAYRIVLDNQPLPEGRGLKHLLAAGLDDWMYQTLLGFRASRDPSDARGALRHLVVEPRPLLEGSRAFDGEPPVRAVEGSLATINGRYEASWQVTDEAFELRVQVPGNCSATLILPDGDLHEVDAGSHHLVMRFAARGDGIPILREVS